VHPLRPNYFQYVIRGRVVNNSLLFCIKLNALLARHGHENAFELHVMDDHVGQHLSLIMRPAETLTSFNEWWAHIRVNTYISSISEHEDSEDQHGRLSMWRAFGGTFAKVAIVLRIPKFTGSADRLNLLAASIVRRSGGSAITSIHRPLIACNSLSICVMYGTGELVPPFTPMMGPNRGHKEGQEVLYSADSSCISKCSTRISPIS
jgi:hypothetical protein